MCVAIVDIKMYRIDGSTSDSHRALLNRLQAQRSLCFWRAELERVPDEQFQPPQVATPGDR